MEDPTADDPTDEEFTNNAVGSASTNLPNLPNAVATPEAVVMGTVVERPLQMTMGTTIPCPHCGEKCPDDHKFCGKCGKVLKQPPLPAGASPSVTGRGGFWMEYVDIDMCGQGDTEIIQAWREKTSIEAMKKTVEEKSYSAITVSNGNPAFGHAALKKFNYQLTPQHCKHISTCCRHPCKMYIYTRPENAHEAPPAPAAAAAQANPQLNQQLNDTARNTNDVGKLRALVNQGADLLSTNGAPWHHTPLHQSSYHGRPDMVRELIQLCREKGLLANVLDLGSNPCGRGSKGTPLELARGGNHQACVRLLEEAAGHTPSAGGQAPAASSGPFPGRIESHELHGCWCAANIPLLGILFFQQPDGPDRLIQKGCLLCFWAIPCPYYEERTREPGTNVFRLDKDHKNRSLYKNHGQGCNCTTCICKIL
eukprot:TRINITY_DN80338_c0_g1_i1.p1 TRINITY_DN80338_c0_g1~~TRINITY_DN80338_c0_g1_i1.p1  ORF type:complete len:423 (+),score=46.84 TRINITY_DN80338_c0_g1_i1:106-1374(+)